MERGHRQHHLGQLQSGPVLGIQNMNVLQQQGRKQAIGLGLQLANAHRSPIGATGPALHMGTPLGDSRHNHQVQSAQASKKTVQAASVARNTQRASQASQCKRWEGSGALWFIRSGASQPQIIARRLYPLFYVLMNVF